MALENRISINMDRLPENSIQQDKHYFIAKLITHPIFMLQHVKTISTILFRRYRIKYLTQWRGQVRKKRHPHWLSGINTLPKSPISTTEVLLCQLPQKEMPASFQLQCHGRKAAAFTNSLFNDPEDYLKEQRFVSLIHALLAEKISHQFTLPAKVLAFIQHPPKKQDAAWETYSTCERAANLITWLCFMPRDQRHELSSIKLAACLEAAMHWIFHHLEYAGHQTNNHILNNGRALIMLGSVLQNHKAVQAGMMILRHMLPILIQPKGSLREGSTHYHYLVLGWLLDAFTFAKWCKQFSAYELMPLEETIVRMCQVARLFCNDAGQLHTQIGDISPDLSPIDTMRRLALCYSSDWSYVLSLHPTSCDDWYYLAFKRHQIIAHAYQGHFPSAYPSHTHNDTTSFVWSYNNEPLLVDTGRSRYTKDTISSLQKSALGHNVPLVNHFAPLCESLIISGHWFPTPYAYAHIDIQTKTNTLILKHDGFKRATPVQQHVRHIALCETYLQIQDQFSGQGVVRIDLLWQFHPSFIHFSEALLTIGNGKYTVKIIITCKDGRKTMTPRIHYFYKQPTLGWYSDCYGTATPHPVLIITWDQVMLPFFSTITFEVLPCAE